MSPKILFTTVLLGAALGLGGCGVLKKKTPDPEPAASVTPLVAPAPTPVAAPAPIVPAEPVLDEAAIPAPQDFEDEAFEKVTPANFKAELARLNKEITAK